MSKSHVLNLYDSIDGSKHYYQKVFSDRVELESNSLPMNFKAGSFNMINSAGDQVSDVVGFLNNLSASLESEISSRGDSILAEEQARVAADN